jgi:hypothetical protein
MARFIIHFHTLPDYTLQFTVTHKLMLPGSGFQRQTFLFSRFPNCPLPKLPASNSNSSQRLNPRSFLTATHVKSKSKSSWQVFQAPPRAQDEIFVSVGQLQVWCEKPSLPRGPLSQWLQLLLAHISAVILRFESHMIHHCYFTVSDSTLSKPERPGLHIYISQHAPVIPPGTAFQFIALPTGPGYNI